MTAEFTLNPLQRPSFAELGAMDVDIHLEIFLGWDDERDS